MGCGLSLRICICVSKDSLECGAEKENGNILEARGESKSLEFKPSLPGSFKDIYRGRKVNHIFIEQCVIWVNSFCIFRHIICKPLLVPFPLGSSNIRNSPLATTRVIIRRRQWHPTPVLLHGKSHGQRSLVGCSPWSR